MKKLKSDKKRKPKVKKARSSKGRRHSGAEQQNNSKIEYSILEMPFAHLPRDKRQQAIRELGQAAHKRFSESSQKIEQVVGEYEPTALLSILSFYATMGGIEQDGTLKPFLKTELGQPHVEIMQAMSLTVSSEKISDQPPGPKIIGEALDALDEASTSFSFKRLSDLDMSLPDEEIAIRQLQEQIRNKTQIVRNWGYFDQVYRILSEIFSPIDDTYLNLFGFTATEALSFFKFLLSEVELRNNERFSVLLNLKAVADPEQMVFEYGKHIGISDENIRKFREEVLRRGSPIQEVFMMIISHYDLFLSDNYTFSVDDLVAKAGIERGHLHKIIEKFSYEWAGLSGYTKEHIFLANPVWVKPIIKLSEDEVFCPLPQMFFSFALLSLDQIIARHNSNSHAPEKELLSRQRSQYLESQIKKIFEASFPSAKILHGLKWSLSGISYQTDLIAVIDAQLIIIEAKSGKISEAALRGAPDRLKHDLDELLIAPNVQSRRLKELLEALISDSSIQDPIRAKMPVDLSTIRRVHRISVSLEDFASIQANVKSIEATKWLPEDFQPCPTFSLGDFETIFDVLEHPVQIMHYISQREILESSFAYVGDELDLLGWYLDNSFNIPNIREDFSETVLTGCSAPIDRYYTALGQGMKPSKPIPRVHPKFKEIIDQLEDRATPGWTEIGILLNKIGPDDQQKLFRLLPKLKQNVIKNHLLAGHDNMLIVKPAPPNEISLAYIFVTNENYADVHKFVEAGMNFALEPEYVEACIVIVKNIDNPSTAYDLIALGKPSDSDTN